MSAPSAGSPRTGRPRATLPTLVMVAAVVTVVTSLGAPLIPAIARSDRVALGEAQWLLTAALLTGALATPAMGRLADGPRKRRVIELALLVVLGGCLLAALSTDFTVLVLGRGLQGVGLGLLPVTMAIARSEFGPEQTRRAVATLSVTAAAGAGLGYPLTALIAQSFGFRGAYVFGALIVAGTLSLVVLVLPDRSDGHARRFDLLGMMTLGTAVVGLSCVLSEGHAWGWVSPLSLGILGSCVVLVVAWTVHELRTDDPLIDVRQVANRSVLTADAAGFFVAAAMYLFLPIVVEFVQIPVASRYGFGASVVTAGLVLVPLSLASLAASRLLGAYELHFGVRSMIPFGALVFGAGTLAFVLAHGALWEAFVASGVSGVGIGFTFAAMPGFIVRAVPPGETGSAMAFYQVLRSIGLSLGSALAAAFLAAATRAGHTFPDFSGFRVTLLVAVGLCVITAVLSYLLPGATIPTRARPASETAMTLDELPADAAALVLTAERLRSDPGTRT